MKPVLPAALLAFAAVTAVGLAALSRADTPLDAAVTGIRSADASTGKQSIADLRRAGPAGLRSLLAEYDRTSDETLLPTIDAVAAQHDAQWSRLFWYTDLDAAKSAAAAEHKPILYFRMLGKLTDEYSCANSRFFRTVLYANESVSKLLRDRFILVWASERPVPVVTIDYGDGRVLRRTLTGNSIHYILNPRCEVIDALPGLYDPDTFAAILNRAAATAVSQSPDAGRKHIQSASTSLDAQWETAFAGLVPLWATTPDMPVVPNATMANTRSTAKEELETPVLRGAAPDAGAAAGRAESKLRVERPLLKATGLPPATNHAPTAAEAATRAFGKSMAELRVVEAVVPPAPQPPMPVESASPIWAILGARFSETASLDMHSIALMRSQNPDAYADPTALDRVIKEFQRSIAADTIRNNLLFRRQILSWLLASSQPIALESLNQRVYSELFLTPRSDPWLGLVPESTYSALTSDGCSIR